MNTNVIDSEYVTTQRADGLYSISLCERIATGDERTRSIAFAENEQDAKRIATAMNEAEGL